MSMAPIPMIVCVEDQEYIELLLRYIRASEYAASIRIRAFSDVNLFMQYVTAERPKGVVAAEETFLEAWRTNEHFSSARWVRLGEPDEQYADGHTMSKYQPLHHLLEQLCSFTGKTTIEATRTHSRALVTCVYSAIAGSGKSVTAMNMAKQLGMKGQSVFYLNLEAASSVHLLTLGDKSNTPELSRLLYDLQAAADQKQPLESSITSHAVYAEEIRSDTFIPPSNFNEWLRMTCEETVLLINYIAESGEYDHVIIDSESGWAERVQAALKHCDRIVWLLTDDLPCMARTEQWLVYWQMYHSDWLEHVESKISFVMNRYTGNVMNSLPEGVHLESTLPYVPSWKQVTNSELLWCSPIFQRDILKLCRMDQEHYREGQLVTGEVGM